MDIPRGRLQRAVHVDRDPRALSHECDVVPVGVIEDVAGSVHTLKTTIKGVDLQPLVGLTDLPHGGGSALVVVEKLAIRIHDVVRPRPGLKREIACAETEIRRPPAPRPQT